MRALLSSVPNRLAPGSVETEEEGQVPVGEIKYWTIPKSLELDANALFAMRGQTARDDPGLNMMFTGQQLQAAMKDLARNQRVNQKKCKTIFNFFMWPLSDMYKHCFGKHQKVQQESEFAGYLAVLHNLHKRTGASDQGKYFLYFSMTCWWMLVFVTVGALILHKGPMHGLEPGIALVSYVWAAAFIGLECSVEVTNLPSETPFILAYKQAALSMEVTDLTRITDGQQTRVTAMGFLSMVCRLHEGDEEDEEEEERDEEDDGDPFNIGRSTLGIFWQQSELTMSLPFLDKNINARESMLYFEVNKEVLTPLDWDERNSIHMQGMQTRIDTGAPTAKGQAIIIAMAGVNAILGMVHRGAMDLTIIGDPFGEGALVLACCAVTFVSSYMVYITIYKVAFQWYTVLIFMEQLASVLAIEGAMRVHLPCYIDPRHEGN